MNRNIRTFQANTQTFTTGDNVSTTRNIDELCINTIRFLSADAVQKANSGHPGLPMGAAAAAYTLWTRFLKFNPSDPKWFDRDRFVLSAGHGSMLLYSLLHLTGYDLSLDEIKNFRQWGSRTPGHPEYGMTPGVEATTGPLGQGIGNAVGMALAETWLAERFNRPKFNLVDHYTYVLCSDGDLMEGVASEASSLAGHLKLGKLIVLYDSNRISIDGPTDLSFSEKVRMRFDAYGWHTQDVADGNDIDAVAEAIQNARNEKSRPSLIEVHTHIGFGSPNKQDKASAHGEPLGEEELELTREKLGWPKERFHIPDEALAKFRKCGEKGIDRQQEWNSLYQRYKSELSEDAKEFQRVVSGELPNGWDNRLPVFGKNDGPEATRNISGKCLNAAAGVIPELIGGSADLAPSNKTLIKDSTDFSGTDRKGRNLRFGVREHGMGAILNGMAYHGGVRPYGGTFLIFSDYMKPSIRLAGLSHLPVIYVFTHDSLGVGEDGPTHQPVEQLVGLRSIPNLAVIRPADANETVLAWKAALEAKDHPTALILSRQNLPVLDFENYPEVRDGLKKGGYVVSEAKTAGTFDLIIAASGSEVHPAIEAKKKLEGEGLSVRVVSFPCREVFEKQSQEYKESVFIPGVPILAVEAGSSIGWKSYVGAGVECIGVDRFGASAPGKSVLEKYGFNSENIYNTAKEILKRIT